ncbi:hypothetical protein TRIUR3_30261 [Triticum urartu]|uniref:Prolamin-like domain-containing protein n=1 Tax=Triticum urartu TaxID=4572 RepID=M7ZXK9_TRIUA|nr:hypothetical protein TRIUR3_30261 [Triticum urartu]
MAPKTAVVAFTLIAAQLLLLLLASTPTTAISIPLATTTGTATVPSGSATGVPALPFPGEDEVAEAAAECWNAVLQAERCAVDVLKWLASGQLAGRVSPACCGVLQRVGRQAKACAVDIVEWLASPEPASHVSLACCSVLQRVGDRCIRDLFPDSAVRKLFAPLAATATKTVV